MSEFPPIPHNGAPDDYEFLPSAQDVLAGFSQREQTLVNTLLDEGINSIEFSDEVSAWRNFMEGEADKIVDSVERGVAQVRIILWTARMWLVAGYPDSAYEEYNSAIEYLGNLHNLPNKRPGIDVLQAKIDQEIERARQIADYWFGSPEDDDEDGADL